MQIMPDLELRVIGNCVTEYGWLQPHPYINKAEVYVPWDLLPNAVAVSTDEGDNPILFSFTSLLHPDIGTEKQYLNRSFAFLALTSQARSYSEGNDPWYLTTNKSVSLNSSAPYKVKDGRPALSGYLWTREIMGDLVLSKDPSARNLLEKPVGVLMPGAAAFVIRSSDVVTLSYAAVLAAPILTVVLTIFAMGSHTAPRFPSGFGKLARRAAALRATQLFHAADELSITDPSLWGGLVSSMPRPTGTQGWTTTLRPDEPTGGGNEGPRIQFTHGG